MQDLDWPFNPQPGLCHFIQSSPGIREKHSTNLRLIVLIHSTFFRERQQLSNWLKCNPVKRNSKLELNKNVLISYVTSNVESIEMPVNQMFF